MRVKPPSQRNGRRASRRWLVALARFDEALQELDILEREDTVGAWRDLSDYWREAIRKVREETLPTK